MEKILEISGAEEVLRKHEVPCLTCPHAQMEIGVLSIGYVCNAYGLDLEEVLRELRDL